MSQSITEQDPYKSNSEKSLLTGSEPAEDNELVEFLEQSSGLLQE